MNRLIARSVMSGALVIGGLALTSASASAGSVCDLSVAPANQNNPTSCPVNGAIFQQYFGQSTGTGVVDPFETIQAKGVEQGYNSSGAAQFDEKRIPQWNHEIMLGDVPIVTIGGVQYRQFFLDINEANNDIDKFLTLDQLQIFVSSNKVADGSYDSSVRTLGGLAPVYDMDTANCKNNTVTKCYDGSNSDNYVQLNYGLNSGSGSGDMVAYIPNSVFAGKNATDYLYLYSMFGGQGVDAKGKADCMNDAAAIGTKCSDSDAGFEEWWIANANGSSNSSVPEPSSMLLIGTGLAALYRRTRRGMNA